MVEQWNIRIAENFEGIFMKKEELPENLQNALKNLRHSSGTIDYDITDSLDNANCLGDFQDRVSQAMDNLIAEAECVKKVAGEKGQESVSIVLTVGEARQIAFETLRSVATLPGWENFKDLVGRELDLTDEILDQAVILLFSDEKKKK